MSLGFDKRRAKIASKVIAATIKVCPVTLKQILTHQKSSGHKESVLARRIVFYLLYKLDYSPVEIAKIFDMDRRNINFVLKDFRDGIGCKTLPPSELRKLSEVKSILCPKKPKQ